MVLIVPDCFLVSIKAQSGGQDIVNVIGVKAPNTTAETVAGVINTAWKSNLGPLTVLPSAYQLIEVKAMSLNSADGQVFALPTTGVGQRVGGLATNGSCALITYGSGSRAKSQKGRMYFGPLRESDTNPDGRTLVSGQTFTDALNVFKNALDFTQCDWGIISRKNSSFTLITSIQTQAVLATQRRRIR